MAKLGYVHYHASSKYKKLLKSSKINNITVKRENGKYYAIANIQTTVEDLELKNPATLSDGEEIINLNLKKEDAIIRKYQKKLSRQK